MDVGRDIEVEKGRANLAERLFVKGEIGTMLFLTFALVAIGAIAGLVFLVAVIAGVIAQ